MNIYDKADSMFALLHSKIKSAILPKLLYTLVYGFNFVAISIKWAICVYCKEQTCYCIFVILVNGMVFQSESNSDIHQRNL